MSRQWLVLVTLWSGAAGAVEAQRVVAPGDTIRLVRVDTRRWERGVVQEVSNGTLHVMSPLGEAYSVPAQRVRRLEVLSGRRAAVTRGANVGGMVGAAGGVALGAAAMSMELGGGAPAEVIPVSAAVFGLGGVFVGAMIGALFREKAWVRAEAPMDSSEGQGQSQGRVKPIIRPGVESTVLLGTRIRW